jgi:site-specific recombinase XerD
VKNYLNLLTHFVGWVDVPIEEVTRKKVATYVDYLFVKALAPKTINCHLIGIRVFYDYLHYEEGIELTNPVTRGFLLRLPRPLPRHLKDQEVVRLFAVIGSPRGHAIFSLMLLGGLRVEEVAGLGLADIDLRRVRGI